MYLVFDIGGTNMRIAVSSEGKTILKTKIIPTPQDFDQAIKDFKNMAYELSNGEKIEVVAGGVAGPIDKDKTMLVSSPHIGGWVGKPLKKSLEETFSVPVYLEHEADLQGLAEATQGAGIGHRIVATLILGTGIASTRTVEGKIDANALAFEAGHQIIIQDGNQCDCGGRGHLEAYVSGSGLQITYGKKGQDISDPQIWDEVAKRLAIGLNNVAVFWSPDAIVLGGVVLKSIPIEKVKSYFKETLTIFPSAPPILEAKLGDSATFLGSLTIINQTRNKI